MACREKFSMSVTERRRRSSDPLDYIEKDPNKHYILASKQTGEAHEYKGFSSQADYFKLARGYEVDTTVDKKLLKNANMVLMTIDKAEKEEWDQEGIVDTNAILSDSTTDIDISGGDPEIQVTDNTIKVESVQRRRTAKRNPVRR